MTDKAAIHVTTELHIRTRSPITPEAFHARVMAFADQLMDLEAGDKQLSDTTISGDADETRVTVEMIVFTDDHLCAVMKAITATRAAIHALGDATPGWPDVKEILAALEQATVQTEPALVSAC